MYLADDAILIVAYGLIGVVVLIFAVYAVKQWRIERRTKKVDARLSRAKAQTWNARRGEWVADDDG